MKTLRNVVTATALVCAFACILSQSALAQRTRVDVSQLRFLEKARVIGAAINSHDVDALEALFGPIVKRELPAEKLKPLIWQMTDQLGTIEQMGEPRILWTDVAVIPVKFQKGLLDLRLTLDSVNVIEGFYFIPHKDELPVPERTTTTLSLPFDGKWNVMWGGDTKEDNCNHDIKNQRYAYDFNFTDEIGKSHVREGTVNEDFFAWGKDVLAPADGRVVEAIDGVLDNAPSSGNAYSSLGNCVVIRHSQYEYSVLSYLKCGSVLVKAGDSVRRYQVVGQCGNSGNSTEPHIHFNMQNTPIMQDASGIRTFFANISVQKPKESEHVEKDYAPVRDERVGNK